MNPRAAFTLVELLVVITIIVILLALLTPALDRAIYQAQLAVCAAHQRTVGWAATNYALDTKRRYPYRPAVDNVDSNWQAITLYHRPGGWGPYDDRPTLRPYMDINKLLNDPLVAPVILDYNWDPETTRTSDATADVLGSMSMWFGYRYDREKGMHKIGDRWTFIGKSYDLLAGDRDVVGGTINVPNGFNNPEGWIRQGTLKTAGVKAAGTQCSHPDDRGKLMNVPLQDGASPWGGLNLNLTQSLWLNLSDDVGRGLIDTNHTYQDLSVRRFTGVGWRDAEQMDAVQTFVNRSGGPQQVPRSGQ